MDTDRLNHQCANKQQKHKKYLVRRHFRQRLPCPACGFGRLIDTGQFTHSEVHVMGQNDNWAADYYVKCPNPKCKAEIGIRKIE